MRRVSCMYGDCGIESSVSMGSGEILNGNAKALRMGMITLHIWECSSFECGNIQAQYLGIFMLQNLGIFKLQVWE